MWSKKNMLEKNNNNIVVCVCHNVFISHFNNHNKLFRFRLGIKPDGHIIDTIQPGIIA